MHNLEAKIYLHRASVSLTIVNLVTAPPLCPIHTFVYPGYHFFGTIVISNKKKFSQRDSHQITDSKKKKKKIFCQ